jgi:hypothetical protein
VLVLSEIFFVKKICWYTQVVDYIENINIQIILVYSYYTLLDMKNVNLKFENLKNVTSKLKLDNCT